MSACVHTRLVTPAAIAGVVLPPPASVVSVMWNVPEELRREFGYGDVWDVDGAVRRYQAGSYMAGG